MGHGPLFLTKLPGYRFVRKEGTVPYSRSAELEFGHDGQMVTGDA